MDFLKAASAWTDTGSTRIAPEAKLDGRRTGEVKSSAATATAGAAARATKSAASASEPTGAPETADPEGVPALRSQLAFTGRLAPMATGVETPPALPAATIPQDAAQNSGANAAGSSHPGQPREADRAMEGAAVAVPAANGDGAASAAPRAPSPSGAPAGRGTDPTVVDHSHGPAAEAGLQAAAAPAAVNPSRPAQRFDSSAAAAGSSPVRPAPATEPAAPQKVAHDITLQLDSGSQRAAVRVVERGGEIHVAVRTADADLAADLRQGLPSLAAKLEQTGYRTETWHPETTPRHPLETASGNAGQNGNDQNGQGSSRERHEGQPQPREAGQPAQTKREGKDFAWFMSSLG
jgi:hypothetical protein